MKRSALWCIALLLAGVSTARAQGLTMQMSNGWAFTFTGNVNAFLVYTNGSVDSALGPIQGGLVGPERVTRIRTGLLPGFANFEASGKEGDLDLKVHFGFAPQINSNSLHDNFGAQIDMREVYLTAGGSWGTILAGRELGLFQRQNILTDMTLFGTGASGGTLGAGGTTLGRIGFGYVYPNFNAQITYSTPAGRPTQFSIGLFDPSVVCGPNPCGKASDASYQGTRLPRVEAELSWTGNMGTSSSSGQMSSADKIMLWVNGTWQNTSASAVSVPSDSSINSAGIGGGTKIDVNGFSLVGSGYYGSGIGTTLMFGQLDGSAIDPNGQSRKSWGYLAQVQYSQPGTHWTIGGSWGESHLDESDADKAEFGVDDPIVKYNRAADVLLSYQWTKSLRWVLEYTWARAAAYSGSQNTSNQGSTGFMLFF